MTTKQSPLHTGFGAETTASEIMGNRRLDGKVAIVTGGYVGCGLETTRALALAGATVIVPARSLDKARAAISDIPRVELAEIELSDPDSVEAFAAKFLASDRPLHFLFNNAGIMAVPEQKNKKGFELQLATNHLGHFELTARLWPALKHAKEAKVIALSSRGHAMSNVDLEDPNFEHRPYEKWKAYGQSKTCNALFALELDRRAESSGVRAFSVHPGAVATELARYVPEDEMTKMRSANPRKYKTPAQGAATSLWAAFQPGGGAYCEDCDFAEPVAADSPEPRGIRPWAMDPELAKALWAKTELWSGVSFDAT